MYYFNNIIVELTDISSNIVLLLLIWNGMKISDKIIHHILIVLELRFYINCFKEEVLDYLT